MKTCWVLRELPSKIGDRDIPMQKYPCQLLGFSLNRLAAKVLGPILFLLWVIVYTRGHQPFWNWELLLGTDSCEGLPVWCTHLWNNNLLNLSVINKHWRYLSMGRQLIMFMLLSEQGRGPTWSVRTTWCLRAPRWWPLVRDAQNRISNPWDSESRRNRIS